MGRAKSTTENPADRETEAVAAAIASGEHAETLDEAVPRLAGSDKVPAFVQYIGGADVREIDARSWAQVDINDQDKVVWDKRKFRGDRVPIDQLTPAAVEYCVQFDGGFRLLDEDGKAV